MINTLNQIILFFLTDPPPPPPFQVKWSIPYASQALEKRSHPFICVFKKNVFVTNSLKFSLQIFSHQITVIKNIDIYI